MPLVITVDPTITYIRGGQMSVGLSLTGLGPSEIQTRLTVAQPGESWGDDAILTAVQVAYPGATVTWPVAAPIEAV